jgi:D-methionine transport system substrate-binding protein
MSLGSRLKTILGGLASLALVGALVACGGSAGSGSTDTADAAADKTITVGASPSPHAEILAQAKPLLAEKGYTLDVVEYDDYVQPNVALSEGDLDANFFQHKPYLDDYNAQNGTDLVSAGAIHFEPMGLYAGKSSSLSAIPDGAKIAVPSDATNEARALLLLQDQGIIKLSDEAGLAATKNDIVENPHNVEIVEVEAASVPRTLSDADFGVANGNYALSAGLDPSTLLASEASDSVAAQTYANVVAVRSDDADSEKTRALIEVLTSDQIRDYINENYQGYVVPVF